jgi:dUTP pyrophosphatase
MARGKRNEAEVEVANSYTDLGPMNAVPYEGEQHAEAELTTDKFAGLMKAVEKTANDIGQKTRSGEPKLVEFCSPQVRFNVKTGIFKAYQYVETPEHKTDASGCFDLEVYLGPEIKSVRAFDYQNREYVLKVQDNPTGRYIALPYGNRALLPTGLVFSLPTGYAMSLVARSSTGFKKGIICSQGFGYIDEDYRDQVFIPVTNTAQAAVRIDHKERLAQAYVHPWYKVDFEVLDQHPGLAGDRVGGIGSTN